VIAHESQSDFMSSAAETAAVYLRRIKFQRVLTLLQEVQVLADMEAQQLHSLFFDGERAFVGSTQDAAFSLLEVLGLNSFPLPERPTLDETLHIIALAEQFASLAFVSYSQGYLVPMQPFYLDTALDRVLLLGSYDMATAPYWIAAEQSHLSCLGEMLRSPVTVFSVRRRSPNGYVKTSVRTPRHDVVACAEGLLGEC
jgi:hypothetical protein